MPGEPKLDKRRPGILRSAARLLTRHRNDYDLNLFLVFCRLFLAAIFATSGLAKVVDYSGTLDSVRAFGVPTRATKVVAWGLPYVEIALAICLVGGAAFVGGLGAMALLTMFCALIAYQLRKGSAPACHCFGQLHSEPVSRGLLARNIAFMAPALAILAKGPAARYGNSVNWLHQLSASGLFPIFTAVAVLGWIAIALGVALRRNWWRDNFGGTYVPVALSAAYSVLIALFFFKAPGGFDSLAGVQLLFTSPWIALTGWVHYLAFDLFIGAKIARGFEEMGLLRWPLLVLLPLTFLFGPAGYLVFEMIKVGVLRKRLIKPD